MVSNVLMTLAQFDILPHTEMNEAIFDFDFNDLPESQNFYEAGYETSNFVLNSGSCFWFVLIWILLSIAQKILVYFKKLPMFTKKLGNLIFYSLIIRIALESYLELIINAILNVKEVGLISYLICFIVEMDNHTCWRVFFFYFLC